MKAGCITNFDMFFLMVGAICLVDEIKFMLIRASNSNTSKAAPDWCISVWWAGVLYRCDLEAKLQIVISVRALVMEKV